MKRYYNIAGFKISVNLPKDIENIDRGPLSEFLAEICDSEFNYQLEITKELDEIVGGLKYKAPDRCVYVADKEVISYIGAVENSIEGAYLRIFRKETNSHILVKADSIPYGITSKVVLNAMELEHFIVTHNGLILHASYININGKAILFTAPSGTGKSTQADLWERLRGAEIINGDRAIFKKTDEGFVACGLPFAGSSKICKNVTLPLAAVVYLGQAPSTNIERLTGAEAFKRIWEGCSINTWNEEDVKKASELVTELVTTVPVYHLTCTPDETAIIALEEVL